MVVEEKNTQPQVIEFQSVNFHIRMKRGEGDVLIVLLHGAADPNKRPFPFFQSFLPLNCSQISIADPGIELHQELATSWYLGDESQDLQRNLPAFIRALGSEVGAKRYIFLGGSAGGFAALLYAKLIGADAIAVASCPQLDLLTYEKVKPVDRVRRACFPKLEDFEQFAAKLPVSLGDLYADGFQNHAIILYSAGDRHHLTAQLPQFLAGVGPENLARVVIDVGYWGVLGHSGSVPPPAWSPWVKLALSQQDWSADTLLNARRETDEANRLAAKSSGTAKLPVADKFDKSQLLIAHALRDYQLNGGRV